MCASKKLAIVGIVGVPANYGGFETFVDNLIIDADADVTVYCSSISYSEKLDQYKGAKLVYIPLKANGIQSIFYDLVSMVHTLFTKPDTVLILGVSGCVFLPFYRFLSNSKIVTNIDGLDWKRDKWGKWEKHFLKLSETLAVKYSNVIISDNQGIGDYVLDEYSVTSEVIAYGGDHAIIEKLAGEDDGYALALCRIEPENNVEMILSAFSQCDKKIKFVGNWENNIYGRELIKKYVTFTNIEMINPAYDADKLFKLRSRCSYYIHGHSAGGTNPSLVEMMHFSKPILCFDCVYNRETTENKACYFSSSEQLVKQIEKPSFDNGVCMKAIAQRCYTWEKIREQYFMALNL